MRPLGTARSNYVGGLLAHAPALLAFCAPTTNLYRRLVPGYEAPVNLVYSQRIARRHRHPVSSQLAEATDRVPLPRFAAYPYLAFSAMLIAGLDGIEKGLTRAPPPTSTCSRSHTATPAGARLARRVVGRTRADHAFLTRAACSARA